MLAPKSLAGSLLLWVGATAAQDMPGVARIEAGTEARPLSVTLWYPADAPES